jgi:diaminopimelate decarboxylase
MPQVRPGCDLRGVVGESVLTSTFARVDGELACEGVPLSTIAQAVGTPTYVYSANAVREQYARLAAALDGVPFRIHYSLKANSNLALLRLLRSLGSAADVVSGGELFRARRAGFEPHDIIFGGVGKTEREIADGIDAGVLLLNIESEDELRIVDRLGRERGVVVPVAIRVNPEITVETPHSYIRTGEKGHKFGVPYDEVRDVARVAATLPNVVLHGLDMHVGSQLSRLDAYRHGIERVLGLLAQLRSDGADNLRYLDIGGGLAVTYDAEEPTNLEAFAQIVVPAVLSTGLQLIVEPGRFMVGNAAVLISRVLYRKRSGGKELLVVDAGMTDLLRPSHYNAFHRIEGVRSVEGRSRVDVVGPVCESGDFLALDRELEELRAGDLIAVHSAGAYGYVMSSNYNTRGRPAEVLVDGDRFALVTQRESYEHLVGPEVLEPEWRVD